MKKSEETIEQPIHETVSMDKLRTVIREAGEVVIEIYEHEEKFSQVEMKEDNTPLTLADMVSQRFISEELTRLYPDIPIISEESEEVPYYRRKHWDTYWLVDPLDGTKEFINRNGEFTINIALMVNGKPHLGLVYLPVHHICYYGEVGKGAFKAGMDRVPQPIQVNHRSENRIAMRSKSHASPEEDGILADLGVTQTLSAGSALKFCRVAEGAADVYYRHNPTMEWDTAAGHAVVKAAGGEVYEGNTMTKVLPYNKESLKNGSFLCVGF